MNDEVRVEILGDGGILVTGGKIRNVKIAEQFAADLTPNGQRLLEGLQHLDVSGAMARKAVVVWDWVNEPGLPYAPPKPGTRDYQRAMLVGMSRSHRHTRGKYLHHHKGRRPKYG